jgi:hypothetical protein
LGGIDFDFIHHGAFNHRIPAFVLRPVEAHSARAKGAL